MDTVSPRLAWPLLLGMALAACSSDSEVPVLPAVKDVDTRIVAMAEGAHGRQWDGVVEAVNQATLSAQTQGRVVRVAHDVNDRVDAGTVLLQLTAVEQQAGSDTARAQLRAAEAAAAEADSQYRRFAALADGQFVSKAQIDQARAARDTAVAARDAARAQLAQAGQQADYTVVRSPYGGIVSARNVEPGESVTPGQPLMTVFAPDALRIEVRVPQADADAIRTQPRATITFADGREVEAANVVVFPSADAATHSVPVRISLPALDPAPAPGSTAKVLFPAVDGATYPRIPDSAVVRRGEMEGVYVLADGYLSLRQLRLGTRTGGEVDVIAGLASGEAIATDPVQALQALMRTRESED